MAERRVLDPTWLYGPGPEWRMEQVTDAERYYGLLEAGWKHSPTEFGIETHPARPVQTVMETIYGPTATLAADTALQKNALAQIEEAVLHLQTVQATQDERYVALETFVHDEVTRISMALKEMQGAMAPVARRLDTAEKALAALDKAPAAPPSHSPSEEPARTTNPPPSGRRT